MTVPVTRAASSYSTAIQQRITSGNFFNGVIPVTTLTENNNGSLYKYAPGTVGGLFYWDTNEPIIVVRCHIDLGGSGNISIFIVNLDDNHAPISGEATLIYAATGVRYAALDESNFKLVLLPKQALQVVSTNSSAAQIAQVAALLERTMQR